MKMFRLAAALTFLIVPLTGCYHRHHDDGYPPPPACTPDHPCPHDGPGTGPCDPDHPCPH
ncbi:MAG TPA: hypothetical protein VNU94_01090 [Acidobacteriaceae bacterium]|nr:hypothetical protein [Acidobacteriaceae bacterium]